MRVKGGSLRVMIAQLADFGQLTTFTRARETNPAINSDS